MRCFSCQYDLSQLTEHRCPECGRAFDPNDSNTVGLAASALEIKENRTGIFILAVFALITLLVTLFMTFVD